MKIWIVDRTDYSNPIVKQVDAERVVDHVHAPAGMTRWNHRKLANGDFKWSYVYSANTREEAVAKYNDWFIQEINKLQKVHDARVEELKKRMAK